MNSAHYQSACEQIAELRQRRARPVEALREGVASDFVSLLWQEGLGAGGELDRAILDRSAAKKSALYRRRVFPIVPIYVTSICSEQCIYCNYRGGNKGVGVERRRLSDGELLQEARFLVEEKGLRVLELVYASDPKMPADVICRHVELLRRLLDSHGGGQVAMRAEAFE